MIRALLIALAVTGRGSQSFNFSAAYLMKLGLPAFSGLGNEQENQAVPRLTELVVYCIFLHTQENAIRPDRLLGFWRR
jgi:hypothetical protein